MKLNFTKVLFAKKILEATPPNYCLHVICLPRYALDDIGSGSHVHLSLWENGKNVFMASGGQSVHGMSKVGEEFMAGVLEHLPSILAFTAPVPNRFPIVSYD